ncbi:MAG: DegT/DnrJ/EryC1/StrS aminotransferase family protein, partial [Calditrichaeota bacterium]
FFLAEELSARKKSGALGRLRGVLPVHIAGQPCDIFAIKAIAREHSLFVVEDAAHCLEGRVEHVARKQKAGATARKDNLARIGTIGDATCFSFYATKNITTAEGGMVTCEDDALAERIRILSLHGMSRDAWKRYMREGSWYYEIVAQGYKYNMPDVLGALGVVQLRKAEHMHALRQRYAEMLMTALADLQEVILPQPVAGRRHAWHLFILRLRPERLNITRNEFIKKLFERGIQASVHFIPLHLHPYFQQTYGLRRGDFPIAERVYDSAVSLPLYPALSEEEVQYIAQTVRALVKDHARPR